MKLSMKPLSSKLLTRLDWPTRGRCLLIAGAMCAWSALAAQAQNIDEGKSAPRLFADSCAACHRSASGLAKGRFRPTLFLFLKDHYTASSGAAWELSSYLASLDTPQKGRSRTATSDSTTSKRRSATRPPAPVPSDQ
jgi:mono/diheme cytochrome c family protein